MGITQPRDPGSKNTHRYRHLALKTVHGGLLPLVGRVPLGPDLHHLPKVGTAKGTADRTCCNPPVLLRLLHLHGRGRGRGHREHGRGRGQARPVIQSEAADAPVDERG